jgi:hypothetical protein
MEENKRRLLPGWKVIRKIGKGSFGTVYEIEKPILLKFKNRIRDNTKA